MKLYVVVEIVRDNEGNPGIHLHRSAAGAASTVARLKEENDELNIDDENVFIIEQEVLVQP